MVDKKSVLLTKLKSAVEDSLAGSHSLKVKSILGLHFMDTYSSRMYYKKTEGPHRDITKVLKKLKLHENVKSRNESHESEKILLGNNYKYEYVNVTDFTITIRILKNLKKRNI